MAFESTKATIKQTKFLTKAKIEFEKEIEFDYDRKNILSINQYSRILNKQVNDGVLHVSGKTKVDISLIVDNEAKNVLKEIEWDKDLDLSTMDNIIVDIVDDAFVSLTDENIVKGYVNLCVESEVVNVIPSVVVENSDIIFKEQEQALVSCVGFVNNSFTLTQELEGKFNISVLSKSAKLDLVKVTCGVDSYIVEGKVNVGLFVKDQDEIYEVKKELDFRQELPFNGLLPTHKIFNKLKVSTFIVTVVNGEEKSNIIIALDLEDTAKAYSDENVTTFADAYSTKNELITSEECVNVVESVGVTSQEIQVSDNIVTDDLDLQEIVFIDAINITNITTNNDKFLFDLKYNIVYRSKDNEIKSMNKVLHVEENKSKNLVLWNHEVNNYTYKLKYTNEIEISFALKLTALDTTEKYMVYISDLKLGEAYSEEVPAISVYVAKEGQEIYDIAKTMHVDVEKIRSQNDGIDASMTAGQKIIVYNKL